MFEHLDDPRPYAPRPGLRATVEGRVRRRRRRRVAVTGGVATVAALGVGGVVAGRAARERVTPEQVDVAALPPAEERPEPGEPMTVLLVGVDSNGDPALDDAEGRAGTLTDTIVVARVDPEAGELRTLVVPRDLELTGQPGVRISSVLATGGPDALVAQLEEQLGVEADHYVEVDFAGFRDGVDTLGGLRVATAGAVRAESTGLALGAGCQTIDGDQALALVRARRDLEVQAADGSWVRDMRSDAGRQDRVGVMAAALLRAVADVGPADVPAIVADGFDGVVVDSGLELDDVVALARQASEAQVVTFRLPTYEAPPEGPVVVHLADGWVDVVAAVLGTEAPTTTSGPAAGDPSAPAPDPLGLQPC